MGSFVEITTYGEREACSRGVLSAFTEIARIERLLSIYRTQSDLSRLNAFGKKGVLSLDPELFWVLAKAIEYAERSGGAFDPTAAPLVRLWGFGPGGERSIPPSASEISNTLDRIGFQYLRLASGRIALLKDGIEMNLGGVGKGYAIDRAMQKLRETGIRSALISCGSTIYALGAPPGETGWRIDIRHPRREQESIETLFLRDQAISTSGDYEKFFVFGGRRFSHLIDPRTGIPSQGIASVSVIAPTALEADALSTAAFILGEEGKRFLESFPEVEGLIVQGGEEGEALRRRETRGWEYFYAADRISRRRFLSLASVALIVLLVPVDAGATIVYLTEEEALRKMMPEADRFDSEEIVLSDDQLSRAQQLAGRSFRENRYRFWVGRRGEERIGYATVLEVIGKERPITFLVGIEPNGEVMGVEVLIYRESRGSEIRNARFMGQFLKKGLDNPLRLGHDIASISGATLSARAAVYVVRKALALVEVAYRQPAPG
ncbi:MAG: FAD:protein FMN transferase [Candidatus Manganitrophus sp. SA1]|nr:FAD:protein FMN transferase [Candidatus Manganitrophus morganii]